MSNFTIQPLTPPEGITLDQYWIITLLANKAEETLLDDHIKLSDCKIDTLVRDFLTELDDEDLSKLENLSEDRICELAIDYLGL